MYSLACAKDLVKGSFLLLESDLIYEPRALSELLAAPDEDAILLSGPTDAGDEVFVATLDGYLVDMSKDRDALLGNRGARIVGELVGISRISQPLLETMLRLAGKVFESSLMYDYETDCLVAAARERDIACPLVPDLAWAEIDDPDHLRRAREDVYPEIRRLTTKN
jgi:2-aminoethylphosphonate-pyruvate transaminase